MNLSRCYVILEPRPEAEVRVLCFHHAGGSALSFAPLVRQLPPQVELCLFELPGRGLTAKEPFLANFSAAKDYFLQSVLEVVDRPTIFLGHSLGGLFAHALACALPAEKKSFVRTIIVSATRSPKTVASHASYPAAPFVIRSRASILKDMVRLGGTPPEILDNPELLEQTITTVGHDFHLIDTYSRLGHTPMECPIELWYGRNDAADPQEEANCWSEATSARIQLRLFDGNHFYIFRNHEPTLALCTIVQATTSRIRLEKHV